MEQPGEQLAAGEIAGCPEEHHHMGTEGRDQSGVDVGRFGMHVINPRSRGPQHAPQGLAGKLHTSNNYLNIRGRARTVHELVDHRSPVGHARGREFATWGSTGASGNSAYPPACAGASST